MLWLACWFWLIFFPEPVKGFIAMNAIRDTHHRNALSATNTYGEERDSTPREKNSFQPPAGGFFFLHTMKHNRGMKTLCYNRRAKYDYEMLEKLEAGLSLLGTEVKSVKAGNMSLRGAFVTLHNNEAFLTNSTIPPWQVKNAPSDYDPTRSRKVLLKKSELKHLVGSHQTKGLTIVPLSVYTKGPRIKLELALARGKKKHDRKQEKKERDIQRDTERMLRGKE